MSQTNQEAENQYVRRKVWDSDLKAGDGEDCDMGDTILGDVTHPTVIKESGLKSLAALALGGLLTGGALTAGAVAMHLLTKAPDVVETITPGADSETLNIGLGKLEDYLGQ